MTAQSVAGDRALHRHAVQLVGNVVAEEETRHRNDSISLTASEGAPGDTPVEVSGENFLGLVVHIIKLDP